MNGPVSAPQHLTSEHDVSAFDCAVPELSDWLKRRALQNEGTRASRTFVVIGGGRRREHPGDPAARHFGGGETLLRSPRLCGVAGRSDDDDDHPGGCREGHGDQPGPGSMTTASVPSLLHQQVDRWASTRLQSKFSRLLELRALDPGPFNYPIEVFPEWRGKAFYLSVRYRARSRRPELADQRFGTRRGSEASPFLAFLRGPAEIDKRTTSASLSEVCIHCSDTVTFCGCPRNVDTYRIMANLKS